MIIDSHCHLNLLDLNSSNSLETVLKKAREKDVGHFLCVGINCKNTHEVKEIARKYPDVSCSVGIHPLYLEEEVFDSYSGWLIEQVNDPKVVAIGETGLDYFYGKDSSTIQKRSFCLHLEVARSSRRPIIVHTRSAKKDTLRLLRENKLPEGGVLHCFTEDWDMAKTALDLGFYISFSGIVTFKNASSLRDIALRLPIDRILVETDSPYLAPEPYRGKPNYPYYVREVAKFIARLRGESYEYFSQKTTDNFHNLFNLSLIKETSLKS